MEGVMHLLKWAILLFGFWFLLSGYTQPLILTFGVISVVLVVVTIYRMDKEDKQPKEVSTGIRMFRYILWLIREITKSSIDVTKLIWGPTDKISPSLAKVKIKKIKPNSQVLYANSITLTPGTLSIDLDEEEITVHALKKKSAKKLARGRMEKELIKIWGENE